MHSLEETKISLTRHPLAELMYLALPTIAQMSSYTIMHFIDRKMVSTLGTQAAAASNNAGLIAFSFIAFGVGLLTVVNALVSQRYGEKRFDHCGRYLWQGMWISLVYSVLVLPILLPGGALFAMLGHSAELVRMETSLLQAYLVWTLIKLVGMNCGQFLLATNRPNTTLIAAVIGVSVNVVAAYGLIFGKLGMPQLGVLGAAWGQNIGVLVETLVLVGFALNTTSRKRFASLDWKPRMREMMTLVRVGSGSGLQFIGDVLAWSLFAAWVIGAFGEAAMAGSGFAFGYMVTSFMPAHGLAAAVTALVGRYIGMGRPDIAMRRGHLGFAVGAVWMLACGVVFIVWRDPLITFFTTDPQTREMGITVMIFCGIYQIFDAMYVIYSGALRGAGDTLVPAIVSNVLCWGFVVVLARMVAVHYAHWGVAGPWTVATTYGGILGVFLVIRFARGRWKTIHLDNESREHKLRSVALIPAHGNRE